MENARGGMIKISINKIKKKVFVSSIYCLFCKALKITMANLGLFSSHIPYIVLVLSYITCLGYYSFNKKVDAQEVEVNNHFVDQGSGSIHGNHFEYFTEADELEMCQNKQQMFDTSVPIDGFTVKKYPGKDDPGKLREAFEFLLFSRPPPQFV